MPGQQPDARLLIGRERPLHIVNPAEQADQRRAGGQVHMTRPGREVLCVDIGHLQIGDPADVRQVAQPLRRAGNPWRRCSGPGRPNCRRSRRAAAACRCRAPGTGTRPRRCRAGSARRPGSGSRRGCPPQAPSAAGSPSSSDAPSECEMMVISVDAGRGHFVQQFFKSTAREQRRIAVMDIAQRRPARGPGVMHRDGRDLRSWCICTKR